MTTPGRYVRHESCGVRDLADRSDIEEVRHASTPGDSADFMGRLVTDITDGGVGRVSRVSSEANYLKEVAGDGLHANARR